MITKFKIFENVEETPKTGDYVVIKIRGTLIPEIGKIKKITNDPDYPYVIIFDDDFNEDKYGFDKNTVVDLSEIEYCSDNKEDLELLLTANKYNL